MHAFVWHVLFKSSRQIEHSVSGVEGRTICSILEVVSLDINTTLLLGVEFLFVDMMNFKFKFYNKKFLV